MTLEFNLLAPAHQRHRVKAPPLRMSAIALSVVVIVGLGVWSSLLLTHVNRLRRDLASATQEVARLAPVAQHIQALNRNAEQLRARAALLQQVLAQMPASQLIETIRSAIPQEMGLTSVTVGGNTVAVEGYALSYPSVERFMVELENSGGIRHVDLASSQRGTVANHEVVKFRITGDLATLPAATQKEASP